MKALKPMMLPNPPARASSLSRHTVNAKTLMPRLSCERSTRRMISDATIIIVEGNTLLVRMLRLNGTVLFTKPKPSPDR